MPHDGEVSKTSGGLYPVDTRRTGALSVRARKGVTPPMGWVALVGALRRGEESAEGRTPDPATALCGLLQVRTK